jgi:hypothetical protein
MGTASFRIRQRGGAWVVEETHARQLGGIFSTLVAALEFIEGETHRFREACTVIEPSPRVGTSTTRRAS